MEQYKENPTNEGRGEINAGIYLTRIITLKSNCECRSSLGDSDEIPYVQVKWLGDESDETVSNDVMKDTFDGYQREEEYVDLKVNHI